MKKINWYPPIILGLLALLVITFGALVASRASLGPAQHFTASGDQETFEWKLVTTWPKNFPGLGSAPERFAKKVEVMSGGRLKIKVYGAGELVPAMGVFGAVSEGAAQMGHGAAYYWKGKVPAAQFFTAVPFGLNAQEMNGWLHHGGGLQLWEEIYAPFDLIPMAGGSTGVQMAGWFNKQINSVDDLKGLKMRIPGLGGEVLNRAGGTAVTIPGGELYTALQTGVIDATEWVGPYNDLAFGFYQIADYYYYPGWHEPGSILEFIVNKTAFEKLPKDLQAIVRTAARDANQDMLDEYTARNNRALKELVEKHGVQLKRLPADVLAHLKTINTEIMEETAAKDPQFARVYEAFQEFEREVIPYHQISEEAYFQARALEEE
ncbi:TRAP-type mannitol/chloroaromatic compound transport system, substrate-binding protein [Microbulbifer donghaiensis]|uniref:TRAP-type mannitol/chloroaromatic compound transport system, substrate-binding protein n=1 Tax=Microbulbifer donghaiensis TaxID=494016 RepID=A0A1M5AK56_9GAMM|nr:TRAP transporter substrate-binding protein [Microbulbifer donghaiensis]SHF30292.1 TRAP-type mannitol/chloroaromatic compound transport system, substrate-binding protein [Microbulbifer donghaiensis]